MIESVTEVDYFTLLVYYPSGWQSRPARPSRPSLDSPPGLRTIKRDQPPIEN